MSKKLTFSKVNTETINMLNGALDLQFAMKAELQNLRAEAKKLRKESELAETTDERNEEIERQLRIISDKSSGVRKYFKNTSQGYKEGKSFVDGIYTKLGAGQELHDKCVETMASQNTTGLSKYICDEILHGVFGMDKSTDKLCVKLASHLADAIKGYKPAKDSDILKGQLTTDRKAGEVCTVFINALAEYAAKTNLEVCIPTLGTHTAFVEYNTINWTVSGYSVEAIEE